jgi:hypothetical protein
LPINIRFPDWVASALLELAQSYEILRQCSAGEATPVPQHLSILRCAIAEQPCAAKAKFNLVGASFTWRVLQLVFDDVAAYPILPADRRIGSWAGSYDLAIAARRNSNVRLAAFRRIDRSQSCGGAILDWRASGSGCFSIGTISRLAKGAP